MIACLILLSILSLLNLACFGYLILAVSRAKRGLQTRVVYYEEMFESFITAPKEGDPSPLSTMLDSIAVIFSQRISSSLQAAFRGMLGGTMKGLNASLEGEAVESNPQLSLVNMASPQLAKRLGKNPLAMMVLDRLIGKVLGGGGNGTNPGATTILPGRKHHD